MNRHIWRVDYKGYPVARGHMLLGNGGEVCEVDPFDDSVKIPKVLQSPIDLTRHLSGNPNQEDQSFLAEFNRLYKKPVRFNLDLVFEKDAFEVCYIRLINVRVSSLSWRPNHDTVELSFERATIRTPESIQAERRRAEEEQKDKMDVWSAPGEPEPCQNCDAPEGSMDNPVTYGPDPFQNELYGDDTPVWLCEACRIQLTEDI